MNKILLIIQREYLTRVKKKSFLIVTLLTPILISAIYAIPVLLFTQTDNSKTVQILDESGLFTGKFKDNEDLRFQFVKMPLDSAKAKLYGSDLDALVYIPKDILNEAKGVKLFSEKGVNLSLQNKVENTIEEEIRQIKLKASNIDLKALEKAEVKVEANSFKLEEGGQEKSSSAGFAMILSYILAFVLYMSVFIYGSQVMQGVIEEKTNRIVEVVISSVKPFQLMVGKIVGIGLVGLTQFALWILLTVAISTVTGGFLANKMQDKIKKEVKAGMTDAQAKAVEAKIKAESPMAKIENATESLPIAQLLIGVIFFFFGGYLLYSSLFAAVGSAVDSVQDAQQFMWPVTIPIIISIMLAQFTATEPNGSIAFWASMIPFTSPINMVVRIPYGVAWWELLLSMVLLVLGFVATVWVAARIYRVGILMFGKKPSFKELWKWIRYNG